MYNNIWYFVPSVALTTVTVQVIGHALTVGLVVGSASPLGIDATPRMIGTTQVDVAGTVASMTTGQTIIATTEVKGHEEGAGGMA